MPDPQGLCEFGGWDNLIGGEYTTSRGVHPGIFRLRMTTEPNLTTKQVGTVRLTFGGVSMVFPSCATGPHCQRVNKGRKLIQWTVSIYDKRWKWRYPRVSGHYNIRRCDQSVDPDTEKGLYELLGLLLDRLGEPSWILRNVPLVFPQVKWEKAYAARELEHLCDWAGLVICPQLNGTILIEPMGTGARLPANGENLTPYYPYVPSLMPSLVALRTGATVFQSLLNLEAVGIDVDGRIKVLNNLTYKPQQGWARQWFTTFPNVSVQNRHLAFKSVWRWYRLHSQYQNLGVADLETMKSLRIFERLAEAHKDDIGVGRCPEVVVKGIYWPLSDLDVNTAANSIYSGHYTVIPDHNMLAFEYPVVRLDGGELSAAELKVWLSYNAVGPTGEYIDEAIFQQVPNAIASTSPRVEKRNYLKRIRNFASPYGPTVADNIATVIGEANEYLDNIVGTYNGGPEVDMLYDGFEPINLSGCIAQVGFRWGNSRVATTRGSENHEFDCSIRSHQERRRVERLGQLFDKVMES